MDCKVSDLTIALCSMFMTVQYIGIYMWNQHQITSEFETTSKSSILHTRTTPAGLPQIHSTRNCFTHYGPHSTTGEAENILHLTGHTVLQERQ